MYNINAFALSLPVKIIQLCLNIIFRGVGKMTEIVMAVLLAILIGTFGVLSYLLGKLHGMEDMKARIRYILRDSAKIAKENLWTTWKP